MFQISVAVQMAENASEGSYIHVADIETIPAAIDDIPGTFLAAEQVIDRLVADVRERALEQVRQWQAIMGRQFPSGGPPQ